MICIPPQFPFSGSRFVFIAFSCSNQFLVQKWKTHKYKDVTPVAFGKMRAKQGRPLRRRCFLMSLFSGFMELREIFHWKIHPNKKHEFQKHNAVCHRIARG